MVDKKIFWIMGVKFLMLLAIALFGLLALAPDEAQYWTWSRSPSLGYYSKPPGIAWQIFLTTQLFGNNEFGVRLGAFLIGSCQILAVYWLAKRANLSEEGAFWAAFVMAFSPMGFYLSFAATTDGGSALFLTLAVAALLNKNGPMYLLIGLMVALGALYKWTAYFFWPLLLVALPFYPLFRKKSLVGGILISLIGLVPTLYWNYSHDWATFQHVSNTLFEGKTSSSSCNFLDFFSAQMGLISPLFFILLVMGAFKALREKKRELYLSLIFFSLITLFILAAFFKKMQPNWAIFLYPPTLILLGCVNKRWIQGLASVMAIGGIIGALLIPIFQSQNFFSHFPISYKANPFRQNMGSALLGQALLEAGYDPKKDFLFSDKYQNVSLLSFYGPAQKRAYFFNTRGTRKNQYSYWPQMSQEVVGKSGYFAVIENQTSAQMSHFKSEIPKNLASYFDKVEFAIEKPLFCAYGEGVKQLILFRCENYSGSSPKELKKY